LLFCTVILVYDCERKEQAGWKIPDNPLLTEWSLKVDPLKPWPEYPRPDMIRSRWLNLNGLWNYAIASSDTRPEKWDGKILVPYPVESALSGVKKRVTENENLWYRTFFKVPRSWRKEKILLNFEACDWETKVWIDGKEAGSHRGGYDPFSFEISDLLSDNSKHELLVCIWDPTDKGTQPRGKQVSNPGGIWYTPTTGIWQTVWIEPVSISYITSFRVVPDIDAETMTFNVITSDNIGTVTVKISDRGKSIVSATGNPGSNIKLAIKNPILWEPDNPYLYDVTIELNSENGKDRVTSVAGMRKISLGKTHDGFTRMLLNNRFVFQRGPLDQGFWPDGIYTPPTDEAMVFDLRMTKKMGYNMLRKHVKVENRRFYNWCDRLGILVWQDMPSGDKYISGTAPDITKTEKDGAQFEYELKRMIETKYNHPSIIMWVPYNEGWGQWDTERITEFIKEYDPTRLVNSASGWTDRGCGDVHDIHSYPAPRCPEPEEKRAIVLGEYGGLGYPVPGHTWGATNWGYRSFEDTLQLLATFETYLDQIYRFVKEKGLSAIIYTQTTDVETETNGLMTYDRKVDKMGASNVARANMGVTPPVPEQPVLVFYDDFTVPLLSHNPEAKFYYTLDGSDPLKSGILYSGPIKVMQSCSLKTFAIHGKDSSRTVAYNLVKKDLIPGIEGGRYTKGLNVEIFKGEFTSLPDFSSITPVKTTVTQMINARLADENQNFALRISGFIKIPEDGVYGFFLNSDDGSRLLIDGEVVVSNDGVHPKAIEKYDYLTLGQGYHRVETGYFQYDSRRPVLRLMVEQQGKQRMEIPIEWMFH
ncbi:MAG: PA14 domain-containing protein, partial [Bacteroidales bacterium]